MDNATIIKAVEAWQANTTIHPLTCGKDSNHEPLIAVEVEGEVVLACKNCDYLQKWVPQGIIEANEEGMHEKRKKLLKEHGLL